jgi:hypothetical protein
MKSTPKPVRTTIWVGLIFGLSFVPLYFQLRYFFFWPKTIWLILSLYLLVYGFLMIRWSRKSVLRLFPPLLCLFSGIFLFHSIVPFLVIALGILSWIRSGICFQKPAGKRLGAEIILSLGGGVLVAGFAPGSMFTWASGIWLFFLIQALYFVFFEKIDKTPDEIRIDMFERAKSAAEKILSNQ